MLYPTHSIFTFLEEDTELFVQLQRTLVFKMKTWLALLKIQCYVVNSLENN